jgi:archaellin
MIKHLTILLLISISLFARINPFASDPNYNAPTQLEPIQLTKPLNNDDGARTVKLSIQDNIKEDNTTTKVLVNKPLKKQVKKNLSKEEIARLCKIEEDTKKMMQKKHAKKNIPNKMARIKEPFVPATYKVLPFVTIDVNDNDITISSRKKYAIVNYINLIKKKKIAFDFLADTDFSTKFKKLKSSKFKSYKVGNHRKDHFFRVTIDLMKDSKKYKIYIKNNIAKIHYKK